VRELAVISGKGGTGKTSVAASFAALAARGGVAAVIADCDVDAADLHLVLAPDVKRREEFRSGRLAVIRDGDCTGCGECLARCRFEAVRRLEAPHGAAGRHRHVVDETACQGCGVCVRVCPAKAIDFPERIAGEWFVSETRFGPFVHARLAPGREHSGKLVTVIRREAARIAQEEGRELVILDGSPGIGCPVMASVTGATLALIVTEPTVSGLHDFERAAALARKLDVPAAVCVNKWDLNPGVADEIERRARAAGLGVVPRAPYDPDVTRAQIEGRSLVEASDGPAARALAAAWGETVRLLGLSPEGRPREARVRREAHSHA
jgi:MinD superfamily P-loop ATPase